MERSFLLRPYGISTPPSQFVRKAGWLSGSEPKAKVFLSGGTGALSVEADGRVIGEQMIGPMLAESLLGACGRNTITVAETESHGWRILQYEGRHWGITVGVLENGGAEPGDPPFGWKVVREVTGEVCASEEALAHMSEEELASCRS